MKKGFTLIELLAVIVILAIIALIATPIILGIINDAREDSEKRSIENYAHAVELSVARYSAGHEGVIPAGKYYASGKVLTNKVTTATPETLEIDYKGEEITGDVEITKKGEVKIKEASVGNGKTKYNYSEKDGVTKKEDAVTQPSSPFKVTENGILFHYERQSDETSVVVPAEVNGIKIRKIAANAFEQADVIVFPMRGLVVGLNEYAEENKSLADDYEMEFVMFDELNEKNITLNIEDELTSANMYMKGIIDFNDPEIIVYEYDYYLTDVDLSGMTHLESISAGAFKGKYSNSSDACYSSSTCPAGSLKTVKLPMDGVLTTIGENAFSYNVLEEIILPSTLRTLYYGAFQENKLKNITILDGVTKIDGYAFYRNQLTEVAIPSSVTSIGDYAFFYNQNLSTITIKRANSEGITFGYHWNGSAQVEYNMN